MKLAGHLGRAALILCVVALAFVGGRWIQANKHREFPPSDAKPPAVDSPPPVQGNLLLLRTNTAPAILPDSYPDSPDRVADARMRHGAAITAKFSAAGLAYPPEELFLRVLKYEGQLEMWARGHSKDSELFRLVFTYPILCASGRLGPKRQEGDLQVPEGFYLIDRFNPKSLFHLSLGLDYPNASDRLLATDREHPGYDVFIHGGCVSAGCMAMGDPVIEEIFLAAWDAKIAGQNKIHVHIFPCRMDRRNWTQILSLSCAGNSPLEDFWRTLQGANDRFEQTHRVPLVRVNENGAYERTTGFQAD